MSESRIAATLSQGYRRLGLQGQPLVAAYPQLAQVLRNRLGREHAELLAHPAVDPASGNIDWLTSYGGTPRQAATLPDHERVPLQNLAEQLIREIRQLADKLQREGPSAELVGKMLGQAVEVPPGDWLYDVGGKPVLIMWGHAAETSGAAAGVPGLPGAAPATGATAAVAPSTEVPAAEVTAAAAARPWWRRWWWLLALLLLLLLLLVLWWLWAGRAADDAVLGTPRARSAAIDEALARQRALLAELESLRSKAPPAAECKRSDPAYGGPAPGPGGGGRVDPVDPNAQGTPSPGPATSGAAGRSATNPPPVDPATPDANKDSAQRTDPPVPPKPSDPLDVPKIPDDKLSFLRGDWKGGPGLTDTSGRPIDLSMSFGDGGKGTVTIRRPSDGAVCQGPVQGTVQGGKLQVQGSGSVSCQGGGNFAPPRFECARDRTGKTVCNGLNKDGSTYEMDISKAR